MLHHGSPPRTWHGRNAFAAPIARRVPLRTAGILGRQHADIAADVGIPDIAVGIGCEAVRAGVVTRKPEGFDLAVAQAAEARTAHHTEPDRPVPGDRQPAETGILLGHLELGKLSVPPSANAIGAELEKPHRSEPTAMSVE